MPPCEGFRRKAMHEGEGAGWFAFLEASQSVPSGRRDESRRGKLRACATAGSVLQYSLAPIWGRLMTFEKMLLPN